MITESRSDKIGSRTNRLAEIFSIFLLNRGNRLKPVALRKFSTVLMVTVISLVTLSVVIVLFFLNSFFDQRVEKEFRKKLQAEKGQIEILIRNRLDSVKKILEDLSSDNSIRVTMMLDAQSKLLERIRQNYPPDSGVYPFIQKDNTGEITPQSYDKISNETLLHTLKMQPRGDILHDKDSPRLLWFFSRPIVGNDGDMGSAVVLYNMMEDTRLNLSIKSTVKGELKFLYGDQLIPLGKGPSGLSMPESLDVPGNDDTGFILDGDLAYSQIMANRNLYYVSTARELLSERRKVTLLMWIFSGLILAVSVLISVFLAGKMVRPLKEMTRKAIRISEGNDIPLNFERNNEYWEFDQLSEAFNTMFAHLKEAEERSRYQELLENVDDAVYIIDEEGAILDANSSTYEPLGYSREEFFNLKYQNLVPSDNYINIINLGKPNQNQSGLKNLTIETFHIGKDGHAIPVEIQSRQINYMGKSVILNVARDISERIEAEKHKKDLENQLNHAQKMEAMGTMAGCIAHDFNNLLAAIQGNVEILSLGLDRNHPQYASLETINRAIDSATSLTRKLLGFARREESEFMPVNINRLVEETTGMFIKSRKEIKLELKFGNETWPVNGNLGELEQVLVNLYINAWQAMPEGGTLKIKTENVILSQSFYSPFDLPGGDYVHISVSDTGIGMIREIMNKIFDPFFTTKEKGKGTGLGLASTYGIIKNHNGIITVESKVGEGTKFHIYLPAINSGQKS